MRQKGSSWETRPFHASAPGWVFFVRCIASMHLDWLGNSKSGGYSTLLCGEIGVILKQFCRFARQLFTVFFTIPSCGGSEPEGVTK